MPMPSSVSASRVAGATPLPAASAESRLRETARQLQGVFVQQLFQAMRETVPTEGALVSGGLGEDIFRGMLDEHVADGVPASFGEANALTEAIVRQLRARIAGGTAGAAASDAGIAADAADAVEVGSATDRAAPIVPSPAGVAPASARWSQENP